MLTEHALNSIVENLQATGWIAKWTTELKPYYIKYEPRATMKGQVLADFIIEFNLEIQTQSDHLEGWTLNVDGASNNKGTATDIILTTPEVSIIEQSYTLGFPTANNKVKHKAVIVGLRMATILGIDWRSVATR